MPAAVEVDTAALARAARQLADGLGSAGPATARRQAEETASKISPRVPRRTGTLASTVGVQPDGDGWAVTYGGGLPYAAYIERRTGVVADGVDGAAEAFRAACVKAAQQVAGSLR